MLCLIFFGIGACLYPFFSDALNTLIDQYRVSYYMQKADKKGKQKKIEMQKKNEEIAKNPSIGVMDPFEMEERTNSIAFEKYLIGKIIIPKIRVNIPVYDRTNDVLLQEGATLLNGTSFPIGGNNTHAVLSAHRGLSSKQFFTQLPKLKKDDIFILHTLDKRLAYKVDKISTIEPTDTSWLSIEKDQDLVTLMTCTPYMINSHRLLVRGHRVPYDELIEKKENKTIKDQRLIQIGLAILILVLLIMFLRITKKIFNDNAKKKLK